MFRRQRHRSACLRIALLVAGSLSLFTAIPSQALETDAWEIKDLGTLPGGTFTMGSAINDRGQVAGTGDLTPRFNEFGERLDRPFAFISQPHGGALHVIDSGPPNDFLNDFSVKSINNAGQVAGTATQGSSFPLAFVTDANGANLHYVTGSPATSGSADSIDVNNNGTVLYQSTIGAVRMVKSDGTITEIRSNSEPGIGIAINDREQAVLNFQPDPQSALSNGYVWSEATGIQPILTDGRFSNAYDINNDGEILGGLQEPGGGLFIVGNDGSVDFVELPDGTLLDTSLGLPKFNDTAQIIGRLRGADGNSFSFVTGANGEDFINIETVPSVMAAGWSDIVVAGINNLGEITGTGTLNGATRAFFLSPAPEPETWAMMIAGLGLLAWFGRRRMAAAAPA